MSPEDGVRCGAAYPDPPSKPCVLRPGHRGMHRDEDLCWWSDSQAERVSNELVEKVMES